MTLRSRRAATARVLYCACVLLACGGSGMGSETHWYAYGANGACVDVPGAAMMEKTGGLIPNCAIAKVVKLCALDPATAEAMCPVTCSHGARYTKTNRSRTRGSTAAAPADSVRRHVLYDIYNINIII